MEIEIGAAISPPNVLGAPQDIHDFFGFGFGFGCLDCYFMFVHPFLLERSINILAQRAIVCSVE